MTRDTVAGESPRCSAKNFRLTDAAEASPCGREDEIVFDRAMGCMVYVVCHKQDCGGKRQGHFFSQVQQRYSCTSWAKNVRKIGLSLPGSSTMYSSFCLHSS